MPVVRHLTSSDDRRFEVLLIDGVLRAVRLDVADHAEAIHFPEDGSDGVLVVEADSRAWFAENVTVAQAAGLTRSAMSGSGFVELGRSEPSWYPSAKARIERGHVGAGYVTEYEDGEVWASIESQHAGLDVFETSKTSRLEEAVEWARLRARTVRVTTPHGDFTAGVVPLPRWPRFQT
ncbi:hypothetical protein VB690_16770 [Nodularia spumigena CH309]|nr:hypothetical protein [Nodularia spumigena CH309]